MGDETVIARDSSGACSIIWWCFSADQALAPQRQLAFARRFGEPMEYPQLKGLPECPLITPVIKLEHERVNFGGMWHSDTSYLERALPWPACSMPSTRRRYGGDTVFANQYLAYEALSEGMRQAAPTALTGVNSSTKAEVTRDRARMRLRAGRRRAQGVDRRCIRSYARIPRPGRKALYVNAGHTTHFQGWTEEESRPPARATYSRHQVKPEFTCRFRWESGALAFWDNRCTFSTTLSTTTTDSDGSCTA